MHLLFRKGFRAIEVSLEYSSRSEVAFPFCLLPRLVERLRHAPGGVGADVWPFAVVQERDPGSFPPCWSDLRRLEEAEPFISRQALTESLLIFSCDKEGQFLPPLSGAGIFIPFPFYDFRLPAPMESRRLSRH